MAELENIIGLLDSSNTTSKLDGAEKLRDYLQNLDSRRSPDHEAVKYLIDSVNNMAKTHNSKVREIKLAAVVVYISQVTN